MRLVWRICALTRVERCADGPVRHGTTGADRVPADVRAHADLAHADQRGGHPIGLSRAERDSASRARWSFLSPTRSDSRSIDRSRDRVSRRGVRSLCDCAFWRVRSARSIVPFHFGSAIRPVWGFPIAFDELPLLRRMGKIVIATFQGDDARPPGRWQDQPDAEHWRGVERRRRHARSRMLRYANRVLYLNPDLGEWLPGAAFCPYASLDARSVEPVPPRTDGELVVAHAPSHRKVKAPTSCSPPLRSCAHRDCRCVSTWSRG